MRPGPLEIIIIIVVITAIALITRSFRSNRDADTQNKKSSTGIRAWQGKVRTNRARRYAKRSGMVFIIAGIIVLLAGITILRWAFQTYVWSLIIVAIGLILLSLSSKK
jgi:di/tricarboxylate transporter